MQARGYIGRTLIVTFVLTLLVIGALVGLNALGLWDAIGDTASGVVGMLLGVVVLFVVFEVAS